MSTTDAQCCKSLSISPPLKKHRFEKKSVSNALYVDNFIDSAMGSEVVQRLHGVKGEEMVDESEPAAVRPQYSTMKDLHLIPVREDGSESVSLHGVSPEGSVEIEGREVPALLPSFEKTAEADTKAQRTSSNKSPLVFTKASAQSALAPVPVPRSMPCRSVGPPRTHRAITTLHTIAQLAHLVENNPLLPPHYNKIIGASLKPLLTTPEEKKKSIAAELQLHAGETVMFLLHYGSKDLERLISVHTELLSHVRIFTLDLGNLPSQEYEPTEAAPTLRSTQGAPQDRRALSDATFKDKIADVTVEEGKEGDFEEDETLFAPRTPSHTFTLQHTASATPRALKCDHSASGSLAPPPLSDQLIRAGDYVAHRLGKLLRIDAFSNHTLDAENHHTLERTALCTPAGAMRPEPLLFPAMVIWRASGASREEYPPTPPQANSQLTPSQCGKFCEHMARHGGPLVVKQLHSIDAIHSLVLCTPVYTMEHLLRVITASAHAHPSFTTGSSSRTLIYFGASWCPPCMRIVSAMPQLIMENMPENVHVLLKADMDLAKPIFDFFKVEIIPTFIIFDNAVLLEHGPEITEVSLVAPSGGASPVTRIQDEAFTRAELGRLQNSQPHLVQIFLEKNCTKLSFDIDF